MLAEYLSGWLPGERLRVLAGRVVAADMAIHGTGCPGSFACLHETHGFSTGDAFDVAVRARRGGGLTKDAVYLRGLRDLLRRRMLLVQQSVRLLQSVQGYWARATGQRLSANAFRHLTRQQLDTTFIDPSELFAVVTLMQSWLYLQHRIDAIEHWLDDAVRRRPDLAALRTVPGIGPILGLTIVLESGQIQRFEHVGQYTAYCRLVSAHRVSNG